MVRALLAMTAVSALVSGCVVYANEGGRREVVVSAPGVQAAQERLEAVRGVRIAEGRLIVRVGSNGCTDVGSFEVEVSPGAQPSVALKRLRPDPCRALVPDGVEVGWSLTALGLEPGDSIRLANPLKP